MNNKMLMVMQLFNQKILLLLGVLFFLSACFKEYFPEADGSEYKIVVNEFINNEEIIKTSITRSSKLTEPLNIVDLKEAVVSIYEDGNYIEQLNYVKKPNAMIGFFESSFIPIPEKEYSIEINSADFEQIVAKAKIPVGSTIENAQVEYLGGISYNVAFNFDDPLPQNFYYLKMYFKDYSIDPDTNERIYYGNQVAEIPSGSLPQVQRYLDNGFIFKDDDFNGSTVNFQGVVKSRRIPEFIGGPPDHIVTDSTELFIHLETLSETAYNFYSSHAISLRTEIEFFAEEVSVYGNIENGLGIFAGIFVSNVGVEVD